MRTIAPRLAAACPLGLRPIGFARRAAIRLGQIFTQLISDRRPAGLANSETVWKGANHQRNTDMPREVYLVNSFLHSMLTSLSNLCITPLHRQIVQKASQRVHERELRAFPVRQLANLVAFAADERNEPVAALPE